MSSFLTIVKEKESNKHIFYQKEFHNPKDFALDLDGDGVPEFLISDSYEKDSSTFYTLYVFNTLDSLTLAKILSPECI